MDNREERVRAALRLLPLPPAAERALTVTTPNEVVLARRERGGAGSVAHALDTVFDERATQEDVCRPGGTRTGAAPSRCRAGAWCC